MHEVGLGQYPAILSKQACSFTHFFGLNFILLCAWAWPVTGDVDLKQRKWPQCKNA